MRPVFANPDGFAFGSLINQITHTWIAGLIWITGLVACFCNMGLGPSLRSPFLSRMLRCRRRHECVFRHELGAMWGGEWSIL